MIIFNNDQEQKENPVSEDAVNNEEIIENLENDEEDNEIGLAQEGIPMGSIIEDVSEENEQINEKIEELVEAEFSKQHTTKFHKGNLRNGNSLSFDGSIVIIGDVNPGAEVKAKGNILVLGSLKGIAHAGSEGELDSYVFALNMNPVQLRIGDIITRFPQEGRNRNAIIPEYAYVEDGKVYVSTFE